MIVGAGNVALDLARILAAPPGYLAGTLAPERVQAELAAAQIDLLIAAIGFNGVPLPGVPFDTDSGVIPSTFIA